MTTLEKLQAILNSPVEQHKGYTYKESISHTRCVDGVSLSIQASETHYCHPRRNVGPYTSVEVWCLEGTDKITQFRYDEEEPSTYVPIEAVVAFLDEHGGIAP